MQNSLYLARLCRWWHRSGISMVVEPSAPLIHDWALICLQHANHKRVEPSLGGSYSWWLLCLYAKFLEAAIQETVLLHRLHTTQVFLQLAKTAQTSDWSTTKNYNRRCQRERSDLPDYLQSICRPMLSRLQSETICPALSFVGSWSLRTISQPERPVAILGWVAVAPQCAHWCWVCADCRTTCTSIKL